MFASALEQSEQFFTAAAAAGPQTRSLLLFYGLNQAGRALRAAQQGDEGWARGGSHGLSVVAETAGGQFADAVLKAEAAKPGPSFGSAALTLGRSSLPPRMRVGDIARLLFPYAQHPLAGDEPDYPSLHLRAAADPSAWTDWVEGGRDRGLRAELVVPAATWEMTLPEVGVRQSSDYDRYLTLVRSHLARYPTLSGARLFQPVPGHFQLKSHSVDYRLLELEWPDLAPWDGFSDAVLHRFSDDNGTMVRVWPSLPGAREVGPAGLPLATHPLLLWWALLYAAAHFVRYEPVSWAQRVDVDSSAEAVALEEIGERALEHLPELIHRTLVRTEPQ